MHVKRAYVLEKAPIHQVILHNDKKLVEGSLFVANQMRLR